VPGRSAWDAELRQLAMCLHGSAVLVPLRRKPDTSSKSDQIVGELPRVWAFHADDYQACGDEWLLNETERGRARGFWRSGDRARFVAGHVALRRLLGAYLSVPPKTVDLIRLPCPLCGAPHGRPAVAGNSIHFSISYAASLILIALARVPIGVDVEARVAPRIAGELGPLLHPREAAELHEQVGTEQAQAFTQAWTRKEAYLKGLGTGLARDPSADYLGATAGAPTDPAGWAVSDLVLEPGYAGAIAWATPQ